MHLGLGLTLSGRMAGGGAPAFDPASLFASGEEGAWFEPSDLSTLFQNSDGTTAVSVGDPVGYIANKSGNGNHATQATAAARPTLQQTAGGLYYLDFDGVDDWLLATAIGITVNDAWEVVWGTSQGTSGRFFWSMGGVADAVRNGGGSDLRWGTTTSIASLTESDTVFGVSAAVAGSNDLTGYVNGAAQTTITRPSSASADVDLAISSAQTFQFNSGSDANFFGGIWINRQLTAQERADTVEYLAARTGVTL